MPFSLCLAGCVLFFKQDTLLLTTVYHLSVDFPVDQLVTVQMCNGSEAVFRTWTKAGAGPLLPVDMLCLRLNLPLRVVLLLLLSSGAARAHHCWAEAKHSGTNRRASQPDRRGHTGTAVQIQDKYYSTAVTAQQVRQCGTALSFTLLLHQMYYYAGLIMQTSGSSLHSGVVTCLGLLQLTFMLILCCWLPAVTAAAEPLMHVCIDVGIAQPQGQLRLMG